MKPVFSKPNDERGGWYNKTGWLFFWSIVLFPVGLIGLFMNTSLSNAGKWAIGLMGFFVMMAIINNGNKDDEFNQPDLKAQTPEQRREDSLTAAYEAKSRILKDIRYEARHYIKNNLKDPDSFEEIEHDEFEVKDSKPPVKFQSKIKYRAKNSFNGFVVDQKCFSFNSNGGIVDVFDCE